MCGRTRIGSLLVSSCQRNGTHRCTSARRRGDSKRYERQPRLHLLCAPGSHRYDTLTLSPSHPTTHHPVDRRACASASQSASGAELAGASTLVGTLHARSAQWINRIQLHVITITHNRHMPCPPSGRTPQRHLGGWWRFILRNPVNSAFLVTRSCIAATLFSPAHLAVQVASIRTLRSMMHRAYFWLRCARAGDGVALRRGPGLVGTAWLCTARGSYVPAGCSCSRAGRCADEETAGHSL